MDIQQAWFVAHRLVTAFAWRVDRLGSRDMGGLFTPDARLVLPVGAPDWSAELVIEGREAIAARWAARPSDRITRHAYTNLEVQSFAADRIEAWSVGTAYRHDGAGFGAPRPVIVADYDDVLRREPDGVWRFASRRVTPIFVDAGLRV